MHRLFCPIAILAICATFAAADWPQWRGPNRDGVWTDTGIIEKFDAPEIARKWTVEIGGGYSGPVVWNGRVYVTDRITEPRQQERVHCFAWDTGARYWTYAYDCDYGKMTFPTGPRACVTVDDGKVYSIGTMGHLFCLDAGTGVALWSHDLFQEYRVQLPTWGIASAPLIDGDLVVVQAGGADGACIVAFDKTTGAERWRALDDTASYSAPIAIDHAGQRVMICWTDNRVVALSVATGELLWEYGFPRDKSTIAIASPVWQEPYLLFSAFYDGTALLKLKDDEVGYDLVYHIRGKNERNTEALHSCMSTPLIRDGYIYGVDAYGEFRCLKLETGERIWESLEVVPKDRWANAFLVQNAERTWIFNEKGELIIADLVPEEYREISRAKLIEPTRGQLGQRGGVTWSHPAFAYDHVFARNDNSLICCDLGRKQ